MSAQSVTPTLEATSRTLIGKQVKQLRAQGTIPAVVYGHNQQPLSLSLDQRTFEKLYVEYGNTTLVQLVVDGKKLGKVLIHDVQTNSLKNSATHADLYLVNLKEKLTTEIPLNFTGTAEAVEVLGGTLITVKDSIEIECLPDDLVQEIDVDLTPLKTFEDALHVSDIVVPNGITVLTEATQILVSVAEPRSEEEMAELDAAVEEGTTEFETEDGSKPQEGAEGEQSDDKE